MAYYQSNEPYKRDSVMNGALIGSALGGGLTAGAIYGADPLVSQMGKSYVKKSKKKIDELEKRMPADLTSKEGLKWNEEADKFSNKSSKNLSHLNTATDHARKWRGASGKNKLLSMGTGVLAGGLMGMGADALHKSNNR